MTDHPPTDAPAEYATTGLDRSFSTLAPTVRRIALDAVPPRDR